MWVAFPRSQRFFFLLKELQRLYVSSALLVAPTVHAAIGESIGSAAPGAEEGATFESQLSSVPRVQSISWSHMVAHVLISMRAALLVQEFGHIQFC